MKNSLITIIVLLSFNFDGYSTTWTVGNSGLNFTPETLTITLGDEVEFIIGGSHNALEVSQATWEANGNTPLPGFETPFGGGLVTAAELGLGTHYYVCSPHASAGMKGRIIVENCTIPDMPAPIMGETTVCDGTSNTYSISPVSGATSYIWTLPVGWTGSSSTESINTVAGSSGGNITVRAENDCGESSDQLLAVSVEDVPPDPGLIDGETEICAFTSQIYSISPVLGAISYTWFLPSGWSGNSSSESISVISSTIGGDVRVVANNDCGSSNEQTLSILVNSTPNTPNSISGNSTVCVSSQNTYSISPVSGATSYTWTLPIGWTGMSTSESIVATSGMNGGDITVTADNDCGSSIAQFLAVSVDHIPEMPGSIIGNDSICEGTSNTYSVSPISGATSYTWTLPNGWSGTSTTESIVTTSGMNGGDITVSANNDCGSSGVQRLSILVNRAPNMPDTIIGNSIVCEFSTYTYSISPVSGATSYIWTLPTGWSGTSTTESIVTTSGMDGGEITVSAENDCGSSIEQVITVTVNTINTNVDQSGSTLTAELSDADYQWIDCSDNEPINGETNQSFTATSNGDYAVILTKNNCTDTSSCYNIMTTDVNDDLIDNMISISPNPTNGISILSSHEVSLLNSINVLIYNSAGHIIWNEKSATGIIDLSEHPNGVYFIKIWNNEMTSLKKLVVQK